MTFLSALATIIAILLMIFGVNLTELTGSDAPATATVQPIETPSALPSGEATAEAPTEQPTGAVQADVSEGFVSREQAAADVQTLATNVFASVMTGTPYSAPEFVSITDGTRLAARWADYMGARAQQAGDARLTAFGRPGVVPAVKSMFSEGGRITVQADCVLTLKTAAGDTAERALKFTLVYEQQGDVRRVVAIDVAGDEDYDALRAALPAGADSAAIDAAVDAAIAALAQN